MHKPSVAPCCALALAVGLCAPAVAKDRRHKPRLEVGGIEVQILVGPWGAPGAIYFEFAEPIAYPGLACTELCYRRGRQTVHHADCPVLREHLDRFGPVFEVEDFRSAHRPRRHGIPPGHLPPPVRCRVWFDDRLPGHQPPPIDCATAAYYAPPGARIIHGSPPH